MVAISLSKIITVLVVAYCEIKARKMGEINPNVCG